MFFLIVTSLLWSLSFILIKKYLVGVDPHFVSFIRLAISTLIFAPFMAYHIKTRFKWKMFNMGTIQFGLMYIFYISAFQYLDAYQVALLTIVTPFYVLLFNFFFEFKLRPLSFTVVLLNIFVSAWLVYKDGTGQIWGIILMQLSNLCFAWGQVYYKHVRDRIEGTEAEIYFWPYLGATILTGISFAFFGDSGKISMSTTQWGIIAYLGVIASGLGFLFWNMGAKRTSIGNVAISNNLKIPLAIILASVLLGEQVEWIKILIYFTLFVGSMALLKSDQERFL